MTLDRLRSGEAASVVGVDGDDVLARRLGDFGFRPGTRVELLRRAPLGDPAEIRLRGFRVALRRSEAQRVRVTREGDAA